MSIQQFEISIEQSQLDDLSMRLRQARWSPDIDNLDWSYGTSGEYLRSFATYWRESYNWREQEEGINAFGHYRVRIGGVPIHFIHERGKGPDPLPLVLTHGWPWTFWDWHQLIRPLTDPVAHGGDPNDSFDVIVPSLPGFDFSNPLTRTGVTPPVIARWWHQIMVEHLGYDRFGAGGGDWGSFVSSELGIQFPDSVVGVYLSYPPRFHVDLDHLPESDYAPEELVWREHRRLNQAARLSHVPPQTQGPQSLAWALNDSPLGLAGWQLEKRHRWSDCGAETESTFSRDFLITTICLYWFTQSIGPSMRIYADSFRDGMRIHSSDPPARIEVPTGIGVFPNELAMIPRKACERAVNLTHWSVLPRGGHFAPAEQPDLYIEELRQMFRPLR